MIKISAKNVDVLLFAQISKENTLFATKQLNLRRTIKGNTGTCFEKSGGQF
jgi:hypothetical protein